MPTININITISEQECQTLLKNQEAMKALYTILHSLEATLPSASVTSTATPSTPEDVKESKPLPVMEKLITNLMNSAIKGAENTELKAVTEVLTTLFKK